MPTIPSRCRGVVGHYHSFKGGVILTNFSFTIVVFSTSIFLFNLTFSSIRASISSSFVFLYLSNSYCIFAYAFKIVAMSVEVPTSLASTILFLVDIVTASSLQNICQHHGGRHLFLRDFKVYH